MLSFVTGFNISAKITLGNKVKVVTNRLPQNVHGDRYSLPNSEQKAKERSQSRIKEWEHITQQLSKQNKRTFCLILAKEWYDNNKHDDNINKPSTRQALASLAGSAVQFLLPIERTKKDNKLQLKDYFHRVQSALQDLFSAHSGRIDNIQEKVNTYLKKITPEKRPKEIIGITIVRKQKGRARKELEQTYLLIATRLNVETGICELCYACEQNNNLTISEWYHFVDGIKEVAKISPVKLAENKYKSTIRFAEFLNQVISESVKKENNPIILIDSSNCVQICPWLADVRITTHNIKLSSHYEYMENNWNGARIIRIRQDLAPGFIVEKVRQYAQTSLEDTRPKKELTCDYQIPSATSKPKSLFKLKTNSPTGCITYLSIGKKTLHTNQRGQSCYQETEYHQVIKSKKNKANLELCEMIKKPIFIDHYPTPNPLEIVITLRQENDNPDDLAIFVESLRYSFGHYKEWSTLPAPLFFERVVRDYISEFSITDEEDFTSETEDKFKQLSFFD